ncbi:protein of unknown function [Candidatus Methylocalor cossyra]|uniref:Uncharacterized protein n=1 Tax=Candidatus Methylocalor cossyra TaxID=3108543 RepID=A0ABM9NI05_9GAMM
MPIGRATAYDAAKEVSKFFTVEYLPRAKSFPEAVSKSLSIKTYYMGYCSFGTNPARYP